MVQPESESATFPPGAAPATAISSAMPIQAEALRPIPGTRHRTVRRFISWVTLISQTIMQFPRGAGSRQKIRHRAPTPTPATPPTNPPEMRLPIVFSAFHATSPMPVRTPILCGGATSGQLNRPRKAPASSATTNRIQSAISVSTVPGF